MAYQPTKPTQTGIFHLYNIDLREIIKFIDWRFYFLAWRLSGRYNGIEKVHDCPACEAGWLRNFDEKDRPKAEEALKLFRDTQEMLLDIVENKSLKINAGFSIFPAHSDGDNLVIYTENKVIKIPTLRQQKPSSDGFCYSLADFLAEENDYLGFFANTVIGVETMAKKFEAEDDVYKSILVKTIADRLGEAAAEWLHWKVRKEFWGYAPNENLSVEDMLKTQYKGIRPAIGYPSLPDQSTIFELEPLLEFDKIGISLTENGAMYPNASVCGIYFAHPMSRYFMIGKIDEEQLEDYAARKGKTANEIRKWMAANI
ncbi:MAG: vitamin B12 dependent-methionine synthase activation domain-containing protein [Paludibacteraceae bacterium]